MKRKKVASLKNEVARKAREANSGWWTQFRYNWSANDTENNSVINPIGSGIIHSVCYSIAISLFVDRLSLSKSEANLAA